MKLDRAETISLRREGDYRVERRLAAILAADVVGYSRLVEQDEAGTLDALKRQREVLIEPKIHEHKGRVVKWLGDGLLAEFSSAVEAVLCAIEIQRATQAGNAGTPQDRRVTYRIGVNLGDIVIDDDDILGDGVNIAARLEGLSAPGGLCISDMVYQNVMAKLDLAFDDLGERSLKNIKRKVHVWQWQAEDAPARREAAKTTPAEQRGDRPSIAVLPFTNMSGDPDQDFFADGITEDIITDLSKLSNLRVAARNSSFVFKNAQMSVLQIAAELGVRYILEGSVRKAGDNVRITAKLVDGSTDAHIWAERYDRRLSNIFELQDEIATSIVNALKVNISPQEEKVIEKSATRDVKAYETYLRARALLREMTRRSVELARQMFRKAVALDPNYALAYCGLADCASTLAFHYNVDARYTEEALSCGLKALEIDPTLAEARAAYGQALTLKGDNAAAEREFRTAIKLEPNSYEAYFYLATMYALDGDAAKAVPPFLKAFELADHDLQTAMMLSSVYRYSGNTKELEGIARQTVDFAERRLQMNPEDERAAYVGAMALVDLGDLERAREWADLAAATAVEDSRASYNLACLYGLLGDIAESLLHLERALRQGCSAHKIGWMHVDLDLVGVRPDPRFAALMAQYG
jgi:adenylate cyclase